MNMHGNTIITELLQAYLDAKLAGGEIKHGTAEATKRAVMKFITANGNLPIRELNHRHAEIFRTRLKAHYINPTTINDVIKACRPVFKWACHHGWMGVDIFSRLKLLKVHKKPRRIYSDDEVQAMLSVSDEMWRLRILWSYHTGMRLSEMLNLRREDISLRQHIVSIRRHEDTQQTWAWEPKSFRGTRNIEFPVELAEQVALRYRRIPDFQPYPNLTPRQYATCIELFRSGRLTEDRRNRPVSNITPTIDRIQAQAGIPRGTYHNLRHTFATHCALAGMNRYDLAYLMGDHPNTVDEYYVQINEGHANSSLRALRQTCTAPQNQNRTVGVTGYEPATSGPPDQRSNQAELHPE